MAEGDIAALKRGLSSLKFWHVLLFLAVAGGLVGLQVLKGMGLSGVDRSDYKEVAIRFCEDSGRIARELGKINTVRVLGAGRGSGGTSYASMSIRGEDGTGNVHITLFHDEKDQWYVQSATLMTGGKELSIPVSRKDEKRALKVFGK